VTIDSDSPRGGLDLRRVIALADAENQAADDNQLTYADQVQVAYKAYKIGLYELGRDNHFEARSWLQIAVDFGIEDAQPLLALCDAILLGQDAADRVEDVQADEPSRDHAGIATFDVSAEHEAAFGQDDTPIFWEVSTDLMTTPVETTQAQSTVLGVAWNQLRAGSMQSHTAVHRPLQAIDIVYLAPKLAVDLPVHLGYIDALMRLAGSMYRFAVTEKRRAPGAETADHDRAFDAAIARMLAVHDDLQWPPHIWTPRDLHLSAPDAQKDVMDVVAAWMPLLSVGLFAASRDIDRGSPAPETACIAPLTWRTDFDLFPSLWMQKPSTRGFQWTRPAAKPGTPHLLCELRQASARDLREMRGGAGHGTILASPKGDWHTMSGHRQSPVPAGPSTEDADPADRWPVIAQGPGQIVSAQADTDAECSSG
jgi:hypothetical protein